MSTYLDYNASAPLDLRVMDVMVDIYRNCIGNADSRTHDYGHNAREAVEKARKQVSDLLAVSPTEVFFTSGATESNNIAIQGLQDYAKTSGKNHIITSSIEHKAVLETVKAMAGMGFEIDIIDPEPSGRVDLKKILEHIKDNTLLVSLMHVNNETGIIQPVQELGTVLATKNIFFHVDATQSCGKLVEELRNLKYDMLSFSAHKLGGPQGIGVLVLRKKAYKLPPVKAITYGGQQEHGIRPGTIPVALVCGCGAACEIAGEEFKENHKKVNKIRQKLFEMLDSSGIRYILNGASEYCIDSTVNICFPGISSEALMISTKQYCGLSNGSACTSKSYSPSYVLTAMGISEERIESSVRISWGPTTDYHEFVDNFAQLLGIAKDLAQ